MNLPPKLTPAAIQLEKRRAIVQTPFAVLLHAWRLRRVRWAFSTLNRRLDAYGAAYGLAATYPFHAGTENAGKTGISAQRTPGG